MQANREACILLTDNFTRHFAPAQAFVLRRLRSCKQRAGSGTEILSCNRSEGYLEQRPNRKSYPG